MSGEIKLILIEFRKRQSYHNGQFESKCYSQWGLKINECLRPEELDFPFRWTAFELICASCHRSSWFLFHEATRSNTSSNTSILVSSSQLHNECKRLTCLAFFLQGNHKPFYAKNRFMGSCQSPDVNDFGTGLYTAQGLIILSPWGRRI